MKKHNCAFLNPINENKNQNINQNKNENNNQNKNQDTKEKKIENVNQNSTQSVNKYIDQDRPQNMVEVVSENENHKKKGHKRKHKDKGILTSLYNAVRGHRDSMELDDNSIKSDAEHVSPQLERNRRKLEEEIIYSKYSSVMQVCSKNGLAYPRGTPVNVTYYRPSVLDAEYTGPYVRTPYTIGTYPTKIGKDQKEMEVNTSIKENVVPLNEKVSDVAVEDEMMIDENGKSVKRIPITRKLETVKTEESVDETSNTVSADYRREPIQFVYYTECDQVVRYDSEETVVAFSSSSNETALFIGRRREKTVSSAAEDYMGGEIG